MKIKRVIIILMAILIFVLLFIFIEKREHIVDVLSVPTVNN